MVVVLSVLNEPKVLVKYVNEKLTRRLIVISVLSPLVDITEASTAKLYVCDPIFTTTGPAVTWVPKVPD
jgi:hypothetical protein